MSTSIVQAEAIRIDLNMEGSEPLARTSSANDPNVDDPVNDTGYASNRGDFEMSKEFACLLKMI